MNNGFPIGFLGTLWPNNFGISKAIYLPSMGAAGRIISLDGFIFDGWEVYLSQGSQYLKRGKEIQQIHRGDDNCPYVSLRFLSFCAGRGGTP